MTEPDKQTQEFIDWVFAQDDSRVVDNNQELQVLDQEFEKDCKEVTVIKVNYNDIDKLINRHFKNEKHKHGYELAAYEERGSGDCEDWEIDIKPEEITKDSYDYEDIEKIQNGKWPHYSTQTLLNHLCYQGVIKSGNYLIDISW